MSVSVFQKRVDAFRDLLKEKHLVGYVVLHHPDVVYLTGFLSEGASLFLRRTEGWLICPELLLEQAKSITKGWICASGRFLLKIRELLKGKQAHQMGFDPDTTPYGLGQELKRLGFSSVGGLLSTLRQIKDAQEVQAIRSACHLAAQAFRVVSRRLRPGKTERRVAAELEYFFRTQGAEKGSFDIIVGGGPHSAFPHHLTSNTRLKNGEPIVMDLGCVWEGYRSDLTRTVFLGKMSSKFERIYRLVAKAQRAGWEALRSGVKAGSVDAASRRVIEQAGYGKYFVHGTGHGVGLEIHEPPRLAPGSQERLRAGMVVTVEPGIYLPGEFGVRIEDTFLVTPSGSEVLTQ